MGNRLYEELEGLPIPVFVLQSGAVRAANRAARDLFPGWQAGGPLPPPLAGLLAEAEAPAAGLEGCCTAGGQACRVTLSPAREGEQTLSVLPLGQGSTLGPDVLETQLRQCLGELHMAAYRLGRPLEQLEDRRWDSAYFTLQRGLYRLLRMTRHLELLRQLDEEPVQEGMLDLFDLCAGLTGEAEVLARQGEVELTFESRLLTLPFRGDAPLLQILLLNLLSNAIKAAGRQGQVTVRLNREGDRAVLSVEDSGGAGQADLSALFRNAPPDPRPGSGLGIGLTLVRRIALAHGGVVLATREKGTRVTVSLPIREEGMLYLGTPRPDADGGFPRVLVELSDALPASCYDYADLD